MTHDPHDDLWRTILERQTAHDAARSPQFDSLWRSAQQRAQQTGQSLGWMRPAVSLATVSVVIAGLAVCLMRSPLPSDDEALAMARTLSTWQAPTDTLLQSTATAFPNAVPTLTIESIRLTSTTASSPEATNHSTEEMSP
ncbi:MAG: hypothetical protein U0V87_15235 [Acidobacteriota bacterium]